MMSKVYLKKYGEVAGFLVWIVNGKYIRHKISFNFTNYGQHYIYDFIPEKEFWIDRECQAGETRFFVDHLLVENRLMAQGKNKADAIDFADRVERREREKSNLVKKIIKEVHTPDELVKKVHKKLIKQYSLRGIKVWVVKGELVRDFFYVDFTEGGHDKVYSFIPINEIWLDDDISPLERKFVLLHEVAERNLMPAGHCSQIKNKILIPDDNYDKIYTNAHVAACELEYACRQHPQMVDQKLKKELKKMK